MKEILHNLIIFTFISFFALTITSKITTTPVYADTLTTNSATLNNTNSPLPSLDVSSTTVSASSAQKTTSPTEVTDFITGYLDSANKTGTWVVFQTPDFFGDTVNVNGYKISGLSRYQGYFQSIGLDILVVLIIIDAIKIMVMGRLQLVSTLILRIFATMVLYALMVPILSSSILLNNALSRDILTINGGNAILPTFASDYYKSAGQIVTSDPTKQNDVGFYTFSFSDLVANLQKTLLTMLADIITGIAVLFGTWGIIAEAYMRFFGLLFLSLFSPIIIPFVVSGFTQGYVMKFFKYWFTLLIMQPATVLALGIVGTIFNNILSNGTNIWELVAYIFSLFFVGLAPIIAGYIFGEGWIAVATSAEAGIAGKFLFNGASSIANTAAGFTQGIVEGKTGKRMGGFSNMLGRQTYGLMSKQQSGGSEEDANSSSSFGTGRSFGKGKSSAKQADSSIRYAYTKSFGKNNFKTEVQDKEKGLVNVSGNVWGYYDAKNDMTYGYKSKQEALDSGAKENQIKEIPIEKRVIDLSAFDDKKQINPFNATATQRAMKAGLGSDAAHVTKRSDAGRLSTHFSMNKKEFADMGVEGFLNKHYDNLNGIQGKEAIKVALKGNFLK